MSLVFFIFNPMYLIVLFIEEAVFFMFARGLNKTVNQMAKYFPISLGKYSVVFIEVEHSMIQ